MNYIHKLKLQNAAAWQALQVVTIDEQDQQAAWLSKAMTIVEVGTITKPATFDEEGKEITPEQIVEGWHVDVLSNEIIDELREYCLDHLPNHCQHGNDFGDSIDEHGNIIKATVVLKEGEVQL